MPLVKKPDPIILDDVKEEQMLTTLDNPYNPFTQVDSWYEFDIASGYNTCAYLARVALVSDELSETLEQEAIDKAMREIVELNVSGNYILVTKNGFKDRFKGTTRPGI